MKRFFLFIFCDMLLASAGFCQYSLSGKVIDAKTATPINGASVFLNNGTKGGIATAAGTFLLENITAGQYDLIISAIGYQTFAQNINPDHAIKPLLVSLNVKSITLKEINIYPDNVRNRYMQLLRSNFIGTSANAASCKILNPEIINFNYHKNQDLLEASTDEFLLIENRALGYRLKFLLDNFSYNNLSSFSGPVYYEGPVAFEELNGKPSKRRAWLKNRLVCYKGSSMHFFRSASTGNIAKGFTVHTLIRKPNLNKPSQEEINRKILYYSSAKASAETRDSLETWQRKAEMPAVIQYLVQDTISAPDIVKPHQGQGMQALQFSDHLYVLYSSSKKPVGNAMPRINTNGAPYSVITLQQQNALFDNNGIIVDPQSMIFEGDWSIKGKVAEMLPADYEPGK